MAASGHTTNASATVPARTATANARVTERATPDDTTVVDTRAVRDIVRVVICVSYLIPGTVSP